MKNNAIAVVFSIFLCSVSLIHAGIMEDLQSARLAISGDFKEISKWVTDEITEGLAFTAGSGNVMPADVIEFPGYEFGVSAGTSLWPIDAGEFRTLELNIIDTSSINKIDMPDKIGLPNAIGHVRAGLPFDIDVGARYGGFTIDDDEGNAAIDIENSIWGIELRKRILGGTWTNILFPDVSVNVSFDNASGKIEREEPYTDSRSFVYDGTAYTQDITAQTAWETEWNVQNIGIKAMVSKTFVFITPHFGIGINKHMGSTKTKITTTGTLSLEEPFFGTQAVSLGEVNETEINAEDTQVRILTGLEFKLLLLRLGLSAEFSGDYKAYHASLRVQFR